VLHCPPPQLTSIGHSSAIADDDEGELRTRPQKIKPTPNIPVFWVTIATQCLKDDDIAFATLERMIFSSPKRLAIVI
jgi:hypothetical protein